MPAGYISPKQYEQEREPSGEVPLRLAKSRGVFIILGLFLGFFGAHNFYAGYLGRGLAQLLIVLFLGWFVIGFVIVGFWVIAELFAVDRDAAGHLMS